MTLTELPVKDKVTVAQKRVARGGGGASSSNAWVLTSTLPRALRAAPILAPPRAPSASAEAGYVGLTTFVVGLVYLSHGQRISEGQLERQLKRANAEQYLLGDKTERVLRRLEREGYVVKVREREAGGEETVDYVVGPRGKVEVGERGVASLVKNVYGKRDVEVSELEDRLEKSLGTGTFKRRRQAASEEREEPAEGEEAGAEDGEGAEEEGEEEEAAGDE